MMSVQFATDEKAINFLKTICNFTYVIDDEVCTEISFFDEDSIFESTIRRNPLKEKIIEIISNFKNLKKINLRKSKIGNIQKMNSKSLEFIDLSCNDLDHVPTWVEKQKELKHLNLGANKLKSIPKYISSFELKTLKIHKNSITKLPVLSDSIEILNLYLNPFKEIPNSISNLKLKVFSFGVTEIEKISFMNCFENLEWLTITVNKIKEMPDYFCQLKKLKGLQLAKNNIEKIPENIGEMTLSHLTLYGNNIKKIPESFYKLKLEKLNLSKNKIEEKDKLKIKENYKEIKFLKV